MQDQDSVGDGKPESADNRPHAGAFPSPPSPPVVRNDGSAPPTAPPADSDDPVARGEARAEPDPSVIAAYTVSYEQFWALTTQRRGRGRILVRDTTVQLEGKWAQVSGLVVARESIAVSHASGARASIAIESGEDGSEFPCWFASPEQRSEFEALIGGRRELGFQRREAAWYESHGGSPRLAFAVKPIVGLLTVVSLVASFDLLGTSLGVSVESLTAGEYWRLVSANLALSVPGMGGSYFVPRWVLELLTHAVVIAGILRLALSVFGFARTALLAVAGASAATCASLLLLPPFESFEAVEGIEAGVAAGLVMLARRDADFPSGLRAEHGRFLRGALLAVIGFKCAEALFAYLKFRGAWWPPILPDLAAIVAAFAAGTAVAAAMGVGGRVSRGALGASAAIVALSMGLVAMRVRGYDPAEAAKAAPAVAADAPLAASDRTESALGSMFDALETGKIEDAVSALEPITYPIGGDALKLVEQGCLAIVFGGGAEIAKSRLEPLFAANPSARRQVQFAERLLVAPPRDLRRLLFEESKAQGGFSNPFTFIIIMMRVEATWALQVEQPGNGISAADAEAIWTLGDALMAPDRKDPLAADLREIRDASLLLHRDLQAGIQRLGRMRTGTKSVWVRAFADGMLGPPQ